MNNNNNHKMKVVNFSTRDFRGSIYIENLKKIIALPKIDSFPVGPSYFLGVINIAGEVVPVIDLSYRFKMSVPDRYTINTPVLICQGESGVTFGVIVESVYDMAEVEEGMIAKDGYDRNVSMISGVIKYKDNVSMLINVDCLLDKDFINQIGINRKRE